MKGGGNFPKGKIPTVTYFHEFAHFQGIDYHKFKLFVLSLLWRASICSRPPFDGFSVLEFEDEIRKMILDGASGADTHYPIITVEYRINEGVLHAILPPTFVYFGSEKPIKVVTFPIDGLIYMVGLGKLPEGTLEYPWNHRLNASGQMDIIRLFEGEKYIKDHISNLFQSHL